MPEPIKVDFRGRRARSRRKPDTLRAPGSPDRHARPRERAINWRAVPRFLIIVVPILIALAALQWLLAR